MSFLLEGNSRRRSRSVARPVVTPRSRTAAKDAATIGGGGQVQIQRPQRHQPQARIVPQQNQQHQQKQHAMQSAGISMDQVMEDLRVLEEQQRDSQRKLAQVKMLKQSRLERQTAVEQQLSSLKYKNGEQRAQLNRARDVLSKSTHEIEAVKLEASRNDERLKAIDAKLKKALARSRTHQTYRRKIDSRIITIRSRETACQRLLSTLRDDVKIAQNNLTAAKAHESMIRQNLAQMSTECKNISGQVSQVRSEVSGLADDLNTSKQVQASTQHRSESIAVDIQAEETRHIDEMKTMQRRIQETRSKKSSIGNRRGVMAEELKNQHAKLKELWSASIIIQREEGHELSPIPIEAGVFPVLDVDAVLKTVREEQGALSKITTTRDTLSNECVSQVEELRCLEAEHSTLIKNARDIGKASKDAHTLELERTARHEVVLLDLENESHEVKILRSSLIDLETGMKNEKARLDEKINMNIAAIDGKQTDLDDLTRRLTECKRALLESRTLLAVETATAGERNDNSKKTAEHAKFAFQKIRGEVESSRKLEDAQLQEEIENIEAAQKIMLEETSNEITRLLDESPELEEVNYTFDPERLSEERMCLALVDLKHVCKDSKNRIRTKQKQLLNQMREAREEQQRRQSEDAERDRKAKERKQRLLKEAYERERRAQEIAEQEKKEKRRREYDERRRKQAELDSVRREDQRIKTSKREAATEKRIRVGEEVRIIRFQEETSEREKGKALGFIPSTEQRNSTTRFSSIFEDEPENGGESNEDFNIHTDGCLTQRIGLDVPTPKSCQSDEEVSRGTSRASKVHWDSHLSFHMESTHINLDEDVPKAEKSNTKMIGDETEHAPALVKKKEERRKVFGSSSMDRKARARQEKEARRKDRSSKSQKDVGMTQANVATTSHSSGLSEKCMGGSSRELTRAVSLTGGTSQLPVGKAHGATSIQRKKIVSPKPHSTRTSIMSKSGNSRDDKKSHLSSLTVRRPRVSSLEEATRTVERATIDNSIDVVRKQEKVSTSLQGSLSALDISTNHDHDQTRKTVTNACTILNKKVAKPSSKGCGDKITRSEKPSKSRSDKSFASERSRKSVSSSTSKKRSRSREPNVTQSSGIGSGERVASKSRRRRSTDATGKAKAASGGVLAMSDDFGFKF